MARNDRSRLFLNLITTTVFLFPDLTFGQNECKEGGVGGYKKIDDPRRSVESIFKHGQSAICDRAFAWGWYRFDSYTGTKMPTQKVDEMRCGTVHPIWMRGSHPTVAEGTVDRKACINFYDMLNGCLASLNIKVRNCNGFFVYYLGPTHSCSLAYCAGYKKPCPYGQTGNPDTGCVDLVPKHFDNKNLKAPTITLPGKSSVLLLCTVELLNGVEQFNDVEYLIEWFADGKSLHVETKRCHQKDKVPCPNLEKNISSRLPGSKYRAGMWITCKVKARFKGWDWSTPKETNKPFFAGIEVSPSTLRLDLNSCSTNVANKITIKSTIPVLPDPKTGDYLHVGFHLPDGLDLPKEQCESHFLKEDNTTIVVEIMPDCNALGSNLDETKVILITFQGGGAFWTNSSTARTLWVNVFGKPVEQCKSFTDPHYHGMAEMGVTRRFDFMGHGDFVLYKNDAKNFEVQTRQWACNYPGVTCNCGAVLRDHNDVIEFNCCNKDLMFQNTHPTPLQIKLRSSKCLRPGIYVGKKSNGGNDDYTVIFPTGVKVDIERNYWGIDVTILTNRAKGKEWGTCLYEERMNRSLSIDDYGRLQRRNPGTGESLFEVLPTQVNDTKAKYSSICSCKNDKCDNNGDEFEGIHHFNVPSFLRQGMTPYNLCDRWQVKRDVHYSDELTDEDYDLFKSPLPSETQARFKRSLPALVISKQNATRYCTERIKNSKVGKLCADIGIDVQGYVDSCSLDVSYTGDYTFAIGIVSMLTSECGYVAAINESSYKKKNSNGEQDADSIGNEIAELLCPNDCAFNGDCVNSSCVCNKDYTADDCSISIFQKPSLSRLQGDGLCDKRVRPCKKVTVMGMGWLNSTNITCHVVEFKVVNSSWTPNKTERSFPAVMVDLLLVDCYLPDSPVKQGHFDRTVEGTAAAGLTLSVSNDGIHKSDQNLTFISYDSACMACNVSSGCYLNDDSCYINQYCFAPNEVHPDDFCYQCLPNISKNTWTKRQVNHPPSITSKVAFYALYQENLELTFDVVDPEGMPVKISLTDGNPKKAVMKDNAFYWNVTTTKTTTFYLKATDACLASSTFNFTVSLVSCQCQNNGSCSPLKPGGSGFYSCNCPPGFKGAKCETNIDDCQSYPCSQGRCVDGISNYTCICYPGYVGRNCDQDFDDCASSPCVRGNCTDLVSGYTCNCAPGYTGSQCHEDINECLSSPCFYGTCVDQVNSYKCQCEAGYTGRDCDIDIDECQSSPCVNGTCADHVNGFTCSCQAGFSGSRCEVNINECLPVSCGSGTCVDLVNNYTCVCNVGFTGRHCKIAITHCSKDSCYPGVPCFKNGYSISCGSCPSGYQGDGKNCKDINDCANRTCHNGGSCVDGVNSYSCYCLAGFTGDHCETNIDECVSHMCTNGGSCVDGINNYSCNCQPGFTGDRCQTDINDCTNRTCHNGGSCVDGVNSYSCNCLAGFTGDHCETNIDECVNHTCTNGGSCVDGVNNYSCDCQPGFTGDRCQTDINDCTNRTCHNGGSCVDGVNSYSCTCLAGFTGDHCETNMNDCVKVSCHNGGSCVDGFNSYSCNCLPGFTGDHCETNINDCANRTCHNGGSCEDGVNNYSCNCLAGFTGDHCETNIDECVNHTCSNGGSCVDGVNNYSCNCQPGFTGNRCQTELQVTPNLSTKAPAISTKTITSILTASSTLQKVSPTSSLKEPSTSSSIKEVTLTGDEESKTTGYPPTEKPETELIAKLHVEMKWNDDLENQNSAAFKELSRVFEEEIREQYSQDDSFVEVEVLSFKPGSVVAEFQLTFKRKLKDEEALAPLKEGIKDGRMGSLSVDPESLKVKKDKEASSSAPTEQQFPFNIVIGISCGGLFILALIAIYLVRRSQRRKKAKQRRFLDGMPGDVAFPRPEKYELEDRKEDVVHYEEVPISPIGVRYEGLGFSNEAAYCEEVDI